MGTNTQTLHVRLWHTSVAMILVATCSLVLFPSGIVSAPQQMEVIRNARLYSGPSSTSTRIRVLTPPEVVTRLSEQAQNNYVRVQTGQGEVGWVYKHFLVAIVSTSTGVAPFSGSSGDPLGDGEMRAHFIDVGQGAATLLEFTCGAVLIDSGGEKNQGFDSNNALLTYLNQFFARRQDLNRTIDLFALTHPHIDHTRGVSTVIENFDVRNAIDNGQTTGSGGSQQRDLEDYATGTDGVGYEAISRDQIDSTHGRTDTVIDPVNCSNGDPEIRVLWGRVSSNPGWPNTRFGNPNNHSVALRMDFGQFSLLITGDMEDVAIADFVQRYQGTSLLDVDVYEAGHHGSRNGTTTDLITAMTPEAAVIAMGSISRKFLWTAWKYGHPNKNIVLALANAITGTRDPMNVSLGTGAETFEDNVPMHSAIYATGWDGTVVIEADQLGQFHIVP